MFLVRYRSAASTFFGDDFDMRAQLEKMELLEPGKKKNKKKKTDLVPEPKLATKA
jgi:hypothetical protein